MQPILVVTDTLAALSAGIVFGVRNPKPHIVGCRALYVPRGGWR